MSRKIAIVAADGLMSAGMDLDRAWDRLVHNGSGISPIRRYEPSAETLQGVAAISYAGQIPLSYEELAGSAAKLEKWREPCYFALQILARRLFERLGFNASQHRPQRIAVVGGTALTSQLARDTLVRNQKADSKYILHGHKISFNVFSNPEGMGSALKLQDTLRKTRDKMYQAIEEYPETVVYSYYNAEVHTHEQSLHELFGCVYPRALMASGQEAVGIGKTFRSYRADLTHNVETDCCVPHTDCADCRHYGSGSAIIPARLQQHTGSEEQFRAWLDYVDTYLAVWVPNYTKGENLYTTPGRALASVA